jgi:hypothetical protein
MIQFNGHFDGRVITPDERVEIPLNTPLRIAIEAAPTDQVQPVEWKRLLDLAADCAIEGPEDLAERHDHCAHRKASE